MNQPFFRTKGHLAALVLVWGCFAPLAGQARADGVIRDGLGAISAGRGGTNIAHADNGEILLDNPAAMVNIEKRRLNEVSADLLFCAPHYSDPENPRATSLKLFPLAQVSFLRKSGDGRWAFGLGVFPPAGFGAEYQMAGPPLLPGIHEYRSLGAMGKIIPGVAYRLTDRLSIGATLGVGVSHVELEGPYFLQTGVMSGFPTLLDLQATGASVAWSVGLQHKLSDRTAFGLTYIGQTRFHLDGKAAVNVGGLPSRFDADVDLTWPRSLGLGVKHSFCDHRRISADVIWFDWSSAFDEIGLALTNGSNRLLPTAVNDQFPLRWRDSISVRLGYEHFLTPCCVVRAGYAAHRNPIPSDTLSPYIPTILEHAVSVGLGKRWDGYRVDLAYQFSFGSDRSVTQSGIVGDDFSNSRAGAQAHWISVSLLHQF
ncbi:MAG: OmpP1/FadL family transporter [Planctomycetota bacterium]|jgi:long-subunit fatty acid transport protein